LTGLRCGWVDEALRRWCVYHGRTPKAHEQADIAATQASRIEAATLDHDLVLADTTPLMTAVYHHQVFGDSSLDAQAVAWQRSHCALTLLTALDLPWRADGIQRDGPQVRRPVDARLRQLLVAGGLPFAVVSGSGESRLESAIDAVAPLLRQRRPAAQGLFQRLQDRDAAAPLWQWACERCDQPDCEHALRRLGDARTESLDRR
jgi:nicotinamide riboside kinase